MSWLNSSCKFLNFILEFEISFFDFFLISISFLSFLIIGDESSSEDKLCSLVLFNFFRIPLGSILISEIFQRLYFTFVTQINIIWKNIYKFWWRNTHMYIVINKCVMYVYIIYWVENLMKKAWNVHI